MIYMGSYFKQISASSGLLDKSRFDELYDAVQEAAEYSKWDNVGTVKDVRKARDFQGICRVMGIKLIPDGDEMYTVDVDGAYNSSFWFPLLEASAPYMNDGEVTLKVGNNPCEVCVAFTNGTVSVMRGGVDILSVSQAEEEDSGRYDKAVEALGGNEAIERLPQYFLDRLRECSSSEQKADVLEAILEIKSWA